MKIDTSFRGWTLRTIAIAFLAVFCAALTLAAAWFLVPRTSYLHVFLFERSWIQHTNVFIFWTCIATLALDALHFRLERRACRQARRILAGADWGTDLTIADSSLVTAAFSGENVSRYSSSILFSRICRAMDRLRQTQSTKELDDYFRGRSDIDASVLDTSHSNVRYFIWLIPTLGFIGTVMGISQGIAGFADVLQSTRSFEEVQKALPIVTTRLGTAFDTTFLSLVLTAVAVFFMSLLLKRQENLLQEIDEVCIDEVGPLFQESSESTELVQALDRNVNLLIEVMNGNRSAIQSVVRTELPPLLAAEMRELKELFETNLAVLRKLSASVEPSSGGGGSVPPTSA